MERRIWKVATNGKEYAVVSNSSPAAADFTVLTHSPTTAAKRHQLQLQLQLQTASGQKCEREKRSTGEQGNNNNSSSGSSSSAHKKSGTTVEEKKKKKGKRGENGAKYW